MLPYRGGKTEGKLSMRGHLGEPGTKMGEGSVRGRRGEGTKVKENHVMVGQPDFGDRDATG